MDVLVRTAVAAMAAALAACGTGVGDGPKEFAAPACAAAEFPADAPFPTDRFGPGAFSKCRFEEASLPARDYYVYTPTTLAANAPLVVYLHGCNQTAPEGAIQTRWNRLAEEHGMAIAYPEQLSPERTDAEGQLNDGNGARCWNWFRPEHFTRGAGEPAAIAGITRAVANAHGSDAARVYLMGTSAGGVMASTMGATYPDVYAAIAVNAGCGYPACGDASGTQARAAMGEHARVLPAIVFHGTADEAAAFPMGLNAVQQWLGTNDLTDDGDANGSVPRQPAATEQHGVDESALAGLGTVGDLCIGNRTASPCLGGALGLSSYPHTIEHYVGADGAALLDFWIIHGLTHNYVSGDPAVNWSDPIGPDITQAAFEFFTAHPMPGP